MKKLYFSYNAEGEPLVICPYNKMVRVPVTHNRIVPYVGTFACGSCSNNMDESDVCREDDKGFYILCDYESFEKMNSILDYENEAIK